MTRYRYLLSPVLVLLSVSYAVAQTLTTDEPAPQKMWEVLLKTFFPILMTVGMPYLTGLITSGFRKVPQPIQYVISSVLGAIVGALAGQIPDFPLGSEAPPCASTFALKMIVTVRLTAVNRSTRGRVAWAHSGAMP